MTTAQRAAIAAELANLEHGTNRYLKKVEVQNCTSTKITIEDAAKMMGVSRRSAVSAKKLLHDDPESHAAVKAGQRPHKATVETPSVADQAAASLQIQQMALDKGLLWCLFFSAMIESCCQNHTVSKLAVSLAVYGTALNPSTIALLGFALIVRARQHHHR